MIGTNVAMVTGPAQPERTHQSAAEPHPTDTELIAMIARGDRGALDELYRRHAPWLLSRLNRRCGDPDVVDTAIQETFLNVWKHAGKYKPTGEVGAWIWTIGIRRLIDQMRKRPAPTPVDPDHLPRVVTEEVPPVSYTHLTLPTIPLV